jgi:hypothetical protein
MEKLIGLLLALALIMPFMMSCSTIQQTDTNIAIGEIVARRVGATLAAKHPEIKTQAIAYCDTLLAQSDENISGMVLVGLRYMGQKYAGDALLGDDLMSIAKLLGVDFTKVNSVLDSDKFALATTMIKAFKVGLGG